MSAATKAKIAAAQKGNKNAYKGGPVKRGALGGKRDKKTGVKQIRNTGYGKRRAAINVVGLAAATALAVGPRLAHNSPSGYAKGKRGLYLLDYSTPKGSGYKHDRARAKNRANRKFGLGAAGLIAGAVAQSHQVGMAKRKARKSGKTLIVRSGKLTDVYHPVAIKKKNKGKGKAKVPHSPRPAGRRKKK